jgi:TolA-binding protein
MKRTERHKLKENEFARTVAHAREVLATRQRDIVAGVLVILLALAAVGGFVWWRGAREARANDSLAAALAIYEAPVVPIAKPAPGSPAPVPQPGTYTTEEAKLQEALPRFLETADQFPNTSAGLAARYHAAAILAQLGRFAEAEQRYQEVIDRAGDRIYARTARLGLADTQAAQGKYDSAIAIYTELARDTTSQIPVDSVLMQLGRTCARAGRKDEARAAFGRIVKEFPESLYLGDARREMEETQKS